LIALFQLAFLDQALAADAPILLGRQDEALFLEPLQDVEAPLHLPQLNLGPGGRRDHDLDEVDATPEKGQ